MTDENDDIEWGEAHHGHSYGVSGEVDWGKPFDEIRKDLHQGVTKEGFEEQYLQEFEMLPEWAVGFAHGELCLGAQLPTRDGRRCGNAHIIEVNKMHPLVKESVYTVLTDAGSEMHMTFGEVLEQFHPPTWISDVEDVKRKFGRNE